MFERRPLIAGNWKMNLSIKDAVALIEEVAAGIGDNDETEALVAPPFTTLGAVRQAIGKSKIFLAAQNMYQETSGAYTGEVSGRMLQEAGCTHVILGHSERRSIFHETSQDVDLKVKTASVLGLIPVVCIGETLEERESGKTFDIIRQQLDESLHNCKVDQLLLPSTILAYEPVWAIGTGKTATPDQAQEVHAFIRNWIAESFNPGTSRQVRILYGGSANPENIAELIAQSDIDGALVGGASLKADSFVPMIRFNRP